MEPYVNYSENKKEKNSEIIFQDFIINKWDDINKDNIVYLKNNAAQKRLLKK